MSNAPRKTPENWIEANRFMVSPQLLTGLPDCDWSQVSTGRGRISSLFEGFFAFEKSAQKKTLTDKARLDIAP